MLTHINLVGERAKWFGIARETLYILRTKPTLVPQILMELAFSISYLGKTK